MSKLNSGNSQPNDPIDPTYCGFVVGQHVVCIRDYGLLLPHLKRVAARGNKFPEKGKVYTVRSIFINPHGKPALRLAEIVNPVLDYTVRDKPFGTLEWGPAARSFRPLKKLRAENFRSGDAPIEHRVFEGVGA